MLTRTLRNQTNKNKTDASQIKQISMLRPLEFKRLLSNKQILDDKLFCRFSIIKNHTKCVDIDWLTWQQLYLATTALETWQPESRTSEYGRVTSKNTNSQRQNHRFKSVIILRHKERNRSQCRREQLWNWNSPTAETYGKLETCCLLLENTYKDRENARSNRKGMFSRYVGL